ncbi:hypothetical protein CHU94_08345 [Rhodoferax sp. TH121]|uniref:hypothetical protein n=1 Tax=Rhodoferax sp. TH121 TaxID=2022803 RepID=UPI000B96BFAA|nr:hypothetical protein [Rhodoferax sp. TH121]OYQ41110.1 hypothetical protein CHU94_08345 [Rhodoferax sp. TH121]
MRYFKDSGDGFYVVSEDAEPADGWAEISEAEWLASNPAIAQSQAEITRAEIADLLATAKLLPGQEWLLDVAMASMVSAGATQGLTEPQLYAANPGYKEVKDLAAQVSAKKAQL